MKRFIKKVKWLNVLEALLFLGSLAVIIHDLFMVTVYSWFTSQLVGWTWFGLATFMLAIAIASLTYEDLEEKANIVALKKREPRQDLSMEYFVKYSLHKYIKLWGSSQRWW